MNRDPFNIRRSPLPAFQLLRNGADTLQRTASQASQRIVSAIGELDDEIGQKKKTDRKRDLRIVRWLRRCLTPSRRMGLHNGILISGQELGKMDTARGLGRR
jgi:hypothetical protein